MYKFCAILYHTKSVGVVGDSFQNRTPVRAWYMGVAIPVLTH